MTHSFSKIWIHAILGTKFRQPLIEDHFKKDLFNFIEDELYSMNCYPKIINGTNDHVHLLFRLSPQKNVADIIKNIKGLSSHWVNQKNTTKNKFTWQGGYGAFSVSESLVERVYRYILNQEEHHKKISFKKEFDKFLELNGLLID